MAETTTVVKEVSNKEIADFLGTGPGSVMNPDETPESIAEAQRKNFFTRTDDNELIDKIVAKTDDDTGSDKDNKGEDPPTEDPPKEDPPTEDPPKEDPPKEDPPVEVDDKNKKKDAATDKEVDALLKPKSDDDPDPDPDDPDKNKGGRPTNMEAITKALIESKIIVPFDKEEDISKYNQEDYKELYEMNFEKIKKDNLESTQEQILAALPPQLQQALMYTQNGGDDIQGLLRSLSASEEIKSLDISTEQGQEYVIGAYLQAKQFGTPEEIAAEINGYKDRGETEKYAKQFHPQLEAMQAAVTKGKLQEAEAQKDLRLQASQKYEKVVYELLDKGDLNGITLDEGTQELLFGGLTQPTFPSSRGGNTNLFGHLLEKYQWIEPDPGMMAELLWLAADREGYHAKVRAGAVEKKDEETRRQLKNAQDDKPSTSPTGKDDEDQPTNRNVVHRKNGPEKGFFRKDR